MYDMYIENVLLLPFWSKLSKMVFVKARWQTVNAIHNFAFPETIFTLEE